MDAGWVGPGAKWIAICIGQRPDGSGKCGLVRLAVTRFAYRCVSAKISLGPLPGFCRDAALSSGLT